MAVAGLLDLALRDLHHFGPDRPIIFRFDALYRAPQFIEAAGFPLPLIIAPGL